MRKWRVILSIWNFHKQVFSRSDANYWRHFSIFRNYQKVFLLCQLHIREVITWLIVIICQIARFSFIPCLEADIPRGHNLFSKYAWHIYQSKNTQELIKESIVPPYGTPLSAVLEFSRDIFVSSGMNLHVCPRLFAFNLKSKFVFLFVEKSESKNI